MKWNLFDDLYIIYYRKERLTHPESYYAGNFGFCVSHDSCPKFTKRNALLEIQRIKEFYQIGITTKDIDYKLLKVKNLF